MVVTGGRTVAVASGFSILAKRVDEPLLLHSLSEHGELIFAALAAAAPRRIVEIGSETGGFTKQLLDWAGEHDARLATVEPQPTQEIRALAASADAFQLVEGRSPAALADLEPADAYVIDGDHNHWTVTGELEAVYADGRTPLAILHDVGWPCARRDQYYDPDALPADALLPHSWAKGRDPDSEELVAGAFEGAYEFAVAEREGGERNGVLTAVEDFLAAHPGLEYRQLAPVFGVGFIYATDAPYAARLRELLDPWHASPLLERLERNRVRLYARVLELQRELERAALHRGRIALELEDRIGATEAENAALRLERARLRAQLAKRETADTSG
jgi:hypothetical protein